MKRLHGIVVAALMTVALAGCGGLQEMWSGPDAATFKPKTVAVLPPIVGAYEGAREEAQLAMVNALQKTGTFEKVLSAEEVNGAIGISKANSEMLVAYLLRLETLGTSDSETAAKLSTLLQADALVIVKVNAWEYAKQEGDKFGKVGLGARVVDGKKGSIVWKGRDERRSTYLIFKPALKDLATDLSDSLVKYMPK